MNLNYRLLHLKYFILIWFGSIRNLCSEAVPNRSIRIQYRVITSKYQFQLLHVSALTSSKRRIRTAINLRLWKDNLQGCRRVGLTKE